MRGKISAMILGVALAPALLSADVELRGTVIKLDTVKNQIVLKTSKGEETLLTKKDSQGLEHAREGARVLVRYTEMDGQPKVTQIYPLENEKVEGEKGTTQVPR
ncbi:MAG: hypothetical protein HY695_02825 [Deltaproteobacteria bacterium]|nr:hypothetical protein [Deltaproteobacteria bacterium]